MDSLEAWLEAGERWEDFGPRQPWETVKIIRGRRNASVRMAHNIAALTGAAQVGKLKGVEDYLSREPLSEEKSAEKSLSNMDRFFNAYEAHRKEVDG